MAKTATKKESKQLVIVDKAKQTRLQKSAQAKLDEANKLTVKTAKAYNEAADFAIACKSVEEMVGELYDEHVANAHATHKALTTARKSLLDPLSSARKIVQDKMSTYDREQRRLAEEKAQAEAEEIRKTEIADAKKRRDTELVKELKSAPVEAIYDIPTPRVAGVVTRDVFTFKVVDLNAVPERFWILDEAAIKREVNAKGLDANIPGVEVSKDVQTQIRG
jgi:hypothetical protein